MLPYGVGAAGVNVGRGPCLSRKAQLCRRGGDGAQSIALLLVHTGARSGALSASRPPGDESQSCCGNAEPNERDRERHERDECDAPCRVAVSVDRGVAGANGGEWRKG